VRCACKSPPTTEGRHEAYLDVTENLKCTLSATQIAEEIRARIRAETELTGVFFVARNNIPTV
jgi:Zn ribbon nucleic-acid-binding protein